jgi:hypothetical protein
MNDLRKAAEALLNHWEAGEFQNCTGDMAGHIRVLREAAAQPEWVGLTDEVKANWKALGLVGVEIVAAHLKEKNS